MKDPVPFKKDFRFYLKLFWATFSISALTIGGGYVIVPLIRKRFVEEFHWIDDEEMLSFVAIGQSSPGPIAVNTSVLVGYHLAGLTGAIVTVLGTVIPPLAIMSVISFVYKWFIGNESVRALLRGMQAGIAAIILSAVIDMALPIVKKKKWGSIVIMTGAFVLSAFLNVNVIYILLVCLIMGIAVTIVGKAKNREKSAL